MDDLEEFLMEDDLHLSPMSLDHESPPGSLPHTSAIDAFQSDLHSLLIENPLTQEDLSPTVPTGSENRKEQEQLQVLQQGDDKDDGEVDGIKESDSDSRKSVGAKNLISERNRRKRLHEQLCTLRSIVPNITKMDKQSVLEDALAHLQSILQQIDKEKENISSTPVSPTGDCTPVEDENSPLQRRQNRLNSFPAVSKINAEILSQDQYVLEISCNRALGALGLVQQVIEALGLEITCTSINELDQDHLLTKAFLQVKKKSVINEESLKYQVETLAMKFGLVLQ